MDITTDGFGFMLSIGDLTWVPFTYSLQARYLAFHQVDLGLSGTVGIVVLNLIGYYIFRTSNGEKNEFRKGNNPKSGFASHQIRLQLTSYPDLSFMQTERGTKLLTSGWWGRSRHPVRYMCSFADPY
jgi:delta14-sterol reductase